MHTRLIVNADDFGLTDGINRAVAELHAAGAITSATLMARGPAFSGAVGVALRYPDLGIGCHVVLTDGVPVSPPHRIQSLLVPDGIRFRPTLKHLVAALLLRRIDTAELEEEIVAQVEVLQAAGIHVTHLDTHKHTHVFPPIARALLRAAQRTGVRAVRCPFERAGSSRHARGSFLRWLTVAGTRIFRRSFMNLPQIRDGAVLTTAGTLGIAATGYLNRTSLQTILEHLPGGTWELVCHPGYNDADLEAVVTRLRQQREIERVALFETVSAASSHLRSFELIHYGGLE